MEDSARRMQDDSDSSPDKNLSKHHPIPPSSSRLMEDDLFLEESQVMKEIYQHEDAETATIRKKKRDLYCFHCNRLESHLPYKGGWYHGFVTGLTLGLNHWLGPFYCRCCGHCRLMFSDWANLRYWWTMRRLQRQITFDPLKKRTKSRR